MSNSQRTQPSSAIIQLLDNDTRAQLMRLRVHELKIVLRSLNSATYGLKRALQERLAMNQAYAKNQNDIPTFLKSAFSIYAAGHSYNYACSRFQSLQIPVPTDIDQRLFPVMINSADNPSHSTPLNNNNSTSAQSATQANASPTNYPRPLNYPQQQRNNYNSAYSNYANSSTATYRPQFAVRPAAAKPSTPPPLLSANELIGKLVNSPFYEIVRPIDIPRSLQTFAAPPYSYSLLIKNEDAMLLNTTLPHYKRMQTFGSMDDAPLDFPPFVYAIFMFGIKNNSGILLQIPLDFPHKPSVSINGNKCTKFVSRGNEGPVYVPVDLTQSMLGPDGTTLNNGPYAVNLSYEIASNSYTFYTFLVKSYTIPAIHRFMTSTPEFIQSASKVREMVFMKDDEVEATQTVLGLKCPLLYTDIRVPARGYDCTHLQCFDLFNYLMLQKQNSTWICPVCQKCGPVNSTGIGHGNILKYDAVNRQLQLGSVEKGGIRICGYTKDIIDKIGSEFGGDYDGVQVILSEDGDWKIESHSSNIEIKSGESECDDDDYEDIDSNAENRMNALKRQREYSEIDELMNSTSFNDSNSTVVDMTVSSVNRNRSSTSRHPEVIDLTFLD